MVETVAKANALTRQVARDLADLKAYVHANMATKDDLQRFATKEDLKDFVRSDGLKAELSVVKAELSVVKADIFRFGLIATSLLATLILGPAGMIAYQAWVLARFVMS